MFLETMQLLAKLEEVQSIATSLCAIFECCNMAGISVSKEITGYQAGQKDRVGDVVLNSFDHVREMLVDVTCWSPLYLPRIQHSAASSKYTVSEAHSFKLKSRNTNQEGRI